MSQCLEKQCRRTSTRTIIALMVIVEHHPKRKGKCLPIATNPYFPPSKKRRDSGNAQFSHGVGKTKHLHLILLGERYNSQLKLSSWTRESHQQIHKMRRYIRWAQVQMSRMIPCSVSGFMCNMIYKNIEIIYIVYQPVFPGFQYHQYRQQISKGHVSKGPGKSKPLSAIRLLLFSALLDHGCWSCWILLEDVPYLSL